MRISMSNKLHFTLHTSADVSRHSHMLVIHNTQHVLHSVYMYSIVAQYTQRTWMKSYLYIYINIMNSTSQTYRNRYTDARVISTLVLFMHRKVRMIRYIRKDHILITPSTKRKSRRRHIRRIKERLRSIDGDVNAHNGRNQNGCVGPDFLEQTHLISKMLEVKHNRQDLQGNLYVYIYIYI